MSRNTAWLFIVCIHITLAVVFLSDRSCGTNAALTGFPLDDTWIHMVYGRSLAQQGIPAYSHGQLEAGFTSPLWLLFIALAELMALVGIAPSFILIKFLTIPVAMAGSIALFELCLRMSSHRVWAFFGAGLLAASPMFCFAQLSGMEVILTATLIVVSLLMFQTRRYAVMGLALGAATISRPEAVVLVPVFAVAAFLFEYRSSHRRSLRVLRLLGLIVGPTLICGLLWMFFCHKVNGHLLPNTFYAKASSGGNLVRIDRTVREVASGVTPWKWHGGIALYLIGSIMAWKRLGVRGALLVVLPWIYVLAVHVSRPLPKHCGSYFYWWRYWAPALPLLFPPMSLGADQMWRILSAHAHRGGSGAPLFGRTSRRIAMALVIILCFGPYITDLPEFSKRFAWNCQNINEIHVAIGKWVHDNVPWDEAVMVNDAGAIRYFGNHSTIDLFGLNNHGLLFKKELGSAVRNDPGSLGAFADSLQATHLVIFPTWFRRLVEHEAFISCFEPLYYFKSDNYTVLPGEAQSKMFIFRHRECTTSQSNSIPK